MTNKYYISLAVKCRTKFQKCFVNACLPKTINSKMLSQFMFT